MDFLLELSELSYYLNEIIHHVSTPVREWCRLYLGTDYIQVIYSTDARGSVRTMGIIMHGPGLWHMLCWMYSLQYCTAWVNSESVSLLSTCVEYPPKAQLVRICCRVTFNAFHQ